MTRPRRSALFRGGILISETAAHRFHRGNTDSQRRHPLSCIVGGVVAPLNLFHLCNLWAILFLRAHESEPALPLLEPRRLAERASLLLHPLRHPSDHLLHTHPRHAEHLLHLRRV